MAAKSSDPLGAARGGLCGLGRGLDRHGAGLRPVILHDTEDGEVLYEVEYENRRDQDGKRLGPKPEHLQRMPYDLKQIESPVEPRVDVSGQPMNGP